MIQAILSEIKTDLEANLNTYLEAQGLSTIDSFRIGVPQPAAEGDTRYAGIFVDVNDGAEFTGATSAEDFADASVVVMLELSQNDDLGTDSKLYEYADALADVLGNSLYGDGETSRITAVYPQHAWEMITPKVSVMLKVSTTYDFD